MPSVPRAARPFPTSRSYLLAALAFAAFAIYGSLLPFDFTGRPPGAALSELLDGLLTLPRRISRTDFLANILLFVPIGFFLAAAFLVDRRSAARAAGAAAAVLGISLAVSVAAEYLQIFFSGRVPSSLDIVAQTIGSGSGFVAWTIAGQPLTAWLRATWTARREDRLSRVLIAYTAVWVFVSLAPFDITVDVGQIGARLRSGAINVVPFRDTGAAATERIWDAVAEVLGTIPVGMAAAAGWTRTWRATPAMAAAIAAALIVGVETAQVFIASHSADATDVVLGWMGVGIGVTAARRLAVSAPLPPGTGAATAAPRRSVLMLAGWVVVLAAYHWQPFDFTADTALVARKLARMSLVPFAGYLGGSYLNTFSDVLTKLALSAPFGLIGAHALRAGVSRGVVMLAAPVVAAGVFAIIECGQLFLPSRVPDPTDVLVGTAGALVSLALARWIWGR